MNFYYRIEKQTILPLMLLAGGGMNHLMVLVSRYIFMPNDKYGMSSRYALQYQIGVIDNLFTSFGKGSFSVLLICCAPFDSVPLLSLHSSFLQNPHFAARANVRKIPIALAAMFLIGNVMTTAEEFRFGKYRKEHNRDEVKQILLNFENESDKTLEDALEYHKPGCREALTVLKENG